MSRVYIYVDENNIIRNVFETEFEYIDNSYISYNVVDKTLIGKMWDRVNSVAVESNIPEPVIITRREFRNLFTLQEMATLYTVANTDIVIKILLDDLAVSEFIDLTFVSTIQGLWYTVQQGYLTEARVMEILSYTPSN